MNTVSLNKAFATRAAELKRYVRAATNRSSGPGTRFVIFAHYRTGSSLLQNLLNCHPRVHCEGELFLDFMRLKFQKVLAPYTFVLGSLPTTATLVRGFVLRLDQLEKALTPMHGGPAGFLKRLESEGWRFVHLSRENHLRQAISNLTGLVRGQVHDSLDRPLQRTSVHIDPRSLVRNINWMEKTSRKEDALMRGLEHLAITYERDLLDAGLHQQTADRVFGFLGLEPQAATTTFRRISSDDVFASVANGAEIERMIRNSRYASYL